MKCPQCLNDIGDKELTSVDEDDTIDSEIHRSFMCDFCDCQFEISYTPKEPKIVRDGNLIEGPLFN
jgi:hypothetical protein